jgi:spore maturation protein SpmB
MYKMVLSLSSKMYRDVHKKYLLYYVINSRETKIYPEMGCCFGSIKVAKTRWASFNYENVWKLSKILEQFYMR